MTEEQDILQELKRQGRAAIAARAAAEACLTAVEKLAASLDARESPPEVDLDWLEALLPVFDGLDRLTDAAAGARSGPPWARRPAPHAEGLRILRGQLGSALEQLGITREVPLGRPFDPARHRAVEQVVRAGLEEARVERVLSAGYSVGSRVLREAEVVVAVGPTP